MMLRTDPYVLANVWPHFMWRVQELLLAFQSLLWRAQWMFGTCVSFCSVIQGYYQRK
jgi:hypothetical protein